jgi:ribosome-associated toxin RatA of RatAB toxin-antitoxin module
MATTLPTHVTEHSTTIMASPATVYGLVADVASWPLVFRPTVHTEYIERGPRSERIQLWATANGEVRTWTSRRDLDPEQRRVSFRQERTSPPVASMGGEWIITAEGAAATRVTLLHDFQAMSGTPENIAWISRAVDSNSEAELAALAARAELGAAADNLIFSFTDTVAVDGPADALGRVADDVYAFLYDADRWPERLPHVARLDLTETEPNIQAMKMETRTADGSTHTTESVRVCLPPRRIVYKQVVTPALMAAHTGEWLVAERTEGVVVSSQHSVVLNPAAIEPALGAGATVADARAFVHRALSANSTTTLGLARDFAQARARA